MIIYEKFETNKRVYAIDVTHVGVQVLRDGTDNVWDDVWCWHIAQLDHNSPMGIAAKNVIATYKKIQKNLI
jgi:hypothetical protein